MDCSQSLDILLMSAVSLASSVKASPRDRRARAGRNSNSGCRQNYPCCFPAAFRLSYDPPPSDGQCQIEGTPLNAADDLLAASWVTWSGPRSRRRTAHPEAPLRGLSTEDHARSQIPGDSGQTAARRDDAAPQVQAEQHQNQQCPVRGFGCRTNFGGRVGYIGNR